MLKVEIQVVSNNLNKLSSNLRKEASKGVKQSAEECRDYAQSIAAVDIGEMRDSIDAQPEDELTWVTAPHTDHDLFIELGTIKMPPQPFMTPAAEYERPKFIQRMSEVAEKAAGG